MMARLRALLTAQGFRQFVAFFWGSAVGLAIDLVGFQVFVWLGLEPWLANGLSSFISITAVYFLVTRYSFGSGTRLWTYVLFVAWYSMMIVIVSTLIQLLSAATGAEPFLWKLASVPFSFAANYAFSRVLLRRRGPAADSGAGPGPE
jgi:putative flippase GtrA